MEEGYYDAMLKWPPMSHSSDLYTPIFTHVVHLHSHVLRYIYHIYTIPYIHNRLVAKRLGLSKPVITINGPC